MKARNKHPARHFIFLYNIPSNKRRWAVLKTCPVKCNRTERCVQLYLICKLSECRDMFKTPCGQANENSPFIFPQNCLICCVVCTSVRYLLQKRVVSKLSLMKDENGLGIHIAGGKGCRKGDIGIFVAALTEGGAAHR